MNTDRTSTEAVQSAEAEALRSEKAEAQAEERFRAARAELERTGNEEAVTRSSELKQWLDARAVTDAAWGRWAMAREQAEQV